MKSKKTDNKIVIYDSGDGKPIIEVLIEGKTVWLSHAQLVELFQSSKANISEHIKHIFQEGELKQDSVVRKFRTTAADSKNYNEIVSHQNILHLSIDKIVANLEVTNE